MLQLAFDFTARAVQTFRGLPIARESDRDACSWQAADLAPALAAVVPANDLSRLRDDVVARAGHYRHSRGRAFTTHLEGVGAVLATWGQPPLVVQTGLYHSAYSTQQYPYGLYTYAARDELRQILGADGERLVFLFCSHDRVNLYAQVVTLARTGRRLPADGLILRNALTGESARVPRALLAVLLLVHAADLVEQLSGFDFDIVFALLYVLQETVADVPPCLALLAEGGVNPASLAIDIAAHRGTFALAAVLGWNRRLLPLRLTLERLLRGRSALSDAQVSHLRLLEQRFPYVLELPWLRLTRQRGLDQPAVDELLEQVRRIHGAWGATWLKGHFDGDLSLARLVLNTGTAPGPEQVY